MALVESKKLRQIRLEIATKLCIEEPLLLDLLCESSCAVQLIDDPTVETKLEILRGLMKLDSCVRHTILFYAKRYS